MMIPMPPVENNQANQTVRIQQPMPATTEQHNNNHHNNHPTKQKIPSMILKLSSFAIAMGVI
jgi:hypothetical protein